MEEACRSLAQIRNRLDSSKALRMTTSDPAWLSAFQQVLDSDPQNKFVQVATVSTAAADRIYLL